MRFFVYVCVCVFVCLNLNWVIINYTDGNLDIVVQTFFVAHQKYYIGKLCATAAAAAINCNILVIKAHLR